MEMARDLNFWNKEVEVLYYVCNESKGADQLHGFLAHIVKKLQFDNLFSALCKQTCLVQPAHLSILISTFVPCLVDRFINSKVSYLLGDLLKNPKISL